MREDGAPSSRLRASTRLRSVQGNAAATLAARSLTTLSQVVVFAAIVREYGPLALDRYAVAFAVATFAGLALDFGTSLWATREVAGGQRADAFLRARAPLAALIGLIVFVGAQAGLLTLGQALAILVTAVAIAASLLARGIFWGRLMHDREAIFAALESWGLVAMLVAVHFGGLPHVNPLLYTALAYSIGALGRWVTMRGDLRPVFGSAGTIAWARQITAYGVQGLVITVSAQVDIILLSALSVHGAPGTIAAYALALRVYYASPMPLEALGAALLPRFVGQPGRYRRAALLGTVVGTAVAATGAILFYLLAPELGYGSAIVSHMREVLLVLALAFPARCAAYVAGAYVTAQGGQRTRLIASLSALITMAALDLTLIPARGAIGAAWAMVASDWVLLLGYLIGSRQTAIRTHHRLVTHGL
jgi:O-antigen/teichoic acid export membrane protein